MKLMYKIQFIDFIRSNTFNSFKDSVVEKSTLNEVSTYFIDIGNCKMFVLEYYKEVKFFFNINSLQLFCRVLYLRKLKWWFLA